MTESYIRPVRTYFDPSVIIKPEERKVPEKKYPTPKRMRLSRRLGRIADERLAETETWTCKVCGKQFERKTYGRPATMCKSCRKIPKDRREEIERIRNVHP